jgi:hypothetical protein
MFCIGCAFNKSGKTRGKNSFKGTFHRDKDIKFVSSGLTRHLFHRNYNNCLQHYKDFGLCSMDEENIDYSSSIVGRSPIDPLPTYQKKKSYTADQIGLTLTANGPSTIQEQHRSSTKEKINSTLNKQVLYSPFPSSMPRSVMESLNVRRDSDDSEISDGKTISTNVNDDPMNYDNSDSSEEDIEIMNDEVEISDDIIDGCDFNHENSTIIFSDRLSTDQKNTMTMKNDVIPNDALRITNYIPISDASPQLAAEITLTNLITKYRMPMCAKKTIMDWAKTCQERNGFDFCTAKPNRRRETILEDIHYRLNLPIDDVFLPTVIDWLPDNKPTTVYHRPFMKALNSLLSNKSLVTEGNFSFPDNKTPFSPENNTNVPNPEIAELHHGVWWSNTWKARCEPDSFEILVPVIFYMDGISIDAQGRLTLTPLNMTLGIFNVATRAKRPDAWETIYWQPDKTFVSADQSNNPTSLDNVKNLHKGIEIALKSFKEICEMKEGILWDGLPYAGKIWNNIKMKFAIAYVVGDTELHDKLCGRYNCYNGAVKKICRHCNIAGEDAVSPEKQKTTKLWTPLDFVTTNTTNNDDHYWKSVSHHPIQNSFHELDFGINPNNIHFATPGECLHMHQLGVAKRAVESFTDFVMGRTHVEIEGEPVVRRKTKALESFTTLTRNYGAKLTRQSDRDFPRTKFTSNILQPTKKEGSDYAGILLSLVVALSSNEGQQILQNDAGISTIRIRSLIYTLELILGMEEFLKHGRITKDDLPKLKKMIDHFLRQINDNCKRSRGMGTNLLKNHLYFHIPKYMELWGPPAGWDSAPSESNHKTEIKAPSNNTQKNASSFIEQTGKRIIEKRIFERATFMFGLNKHDVTHAPRTEQVCGSKFRITLDNNNLPSMVWSKKQNNKNSHNEDVLHFCCEKVLPLLLSDDVLGFTEHYRIGDMDNTQYLFRANPSFMSSGGQLCNVWYDWALFDGGGDNEDEGIPAQILCLLNISTLKIPVGGWLGDDGKPDFADGYPVRTNGQYAVVRKFKSAAETTSSNKNEPTNIVWSGSIDNKLYLYPCDSINREIAVVQNTDIAGKTSDKFFVVRNRNDWLYHFQNQILIG